MAATSPRWVVNLLLAVFVPVLLVDAFHPGCAAHQAAKDALNPALVVTGLWQGPWRLYAPDVGKDNLRLRAEVVFADGAIATWRSPDWPAQSALARFVEARHTNYFNAILLKDREFAWDALCAYLARTRRHPDGKPAPVASVRLAIRGAVIPPPTERIVPAGPYQAFDDWAPIHTWSPAP
jgi:hypothetical protein